MDIGWLMLDLSHKSCLWMTDPILLRKLWCQVLFHDDWLCLSMSCLETVLSHDVMPWDILSHDIISTMMWPFMTSLVSWCHRMFQFCWSCTPTSTSFSYLLPFISNFLLYPPSLYIQLPLLTICLTLFLRPLIMMFSW